MQRRPRNFVETGAANSIFGLADEIGAGFVGSDDQLQMIPFQRQVYEAMKAKEAEQKREQMNGGGGSQQPTRNSLAGGGAGSNRRTETVRYKPEGENSEANTTFVD